MSATLAIYGYVYFSFFPDGQTVIVICGTVPDSDSEHGTVLDIASEHDMDNMAL